MLSEPQGSRRARTGHARAGLRVLGTTLVGFLCIGALVWVAPPQDVIDQVRHMAPLWLLVAVALEVGSCLSYVMLFRRFFPEPPRRVSRQVAWMAMGAGAVLPGGNISSAAATGFLLRRHGIGTWRLIGRCASLLCLLTLFGFAVNGVAAILLLAGVTGGPHDLLHTGGPILVSLVVLGSAVSIALCNRRLDDRAPRLLCGAAAAIEGAWTAALSRHWRLLGAAGFLCLDMGALWAATAATGHPLGLLAVAIAYCIGYLATMIPVPAGLGVLDSGLAGALVLYGFDPIAAVGAVLVYHAISIWVPGLGGLLAWMPARREQARVRPAVAKLRLVELALIGAAETEA